MTPVTVRVGQVWADNDKRARGRKVKVLEVHTHMADGRPFANPYAIVQPPNGTGRKTTIRLDRFRPNSTGYTLVSDVDGAA